MPKHEAYTYKVCVQSQSCSGSPHFRERSVTVVRHRTRESKDEMAAPSPATIAALHELEVAAVHGFASKCLAIAGVCILIYDHILTFPDEVRLIWKQKWSIVSTIFVLNRYITPLILAIDIYDKGGLADFIPKSFCISWYYTEGAWNIVCFGLIHALVALRVHAIWGRPKWLTVVLSCSFVVYFIATTIIAYKSQIDFVDTVKYNSFFRVCFAKLSPHIWTCWLPALIFETFLFVLTVIKAREHSKANFNTPVVHILYRDGIFYYAIICCCSMFNMMVWLAAPPTLIALSKYFVLAVVPAMGARLVLNLRSSRREDVMPTAGRSTTEDVIVYEMHIKGGLSKPLPGGRFVFASIKADETLDEDEERHLSSQELTYLNQIKSGSAGIKGGWNLV
ncbi:hypothetical protein FRC12_019931 [Ceratobasidium sp. 428]|nr:hypothetical protein FRC12_019931 [Ceratobasidium sp. 428]